MTLKVTAANRMNWSKPFFALLLCPIFTLTARAHDPVFGAGPHVLANLVGSSSVRTGGKQLFLSPGLAWTYRHFVVKTGLQLPIRDDLAADQEPDDYRVLAEFEWHLHL